MDQKEREEKLKELNEKMKVLTDKIKDSAETLAIYGMEATDQIGKKIQESKGDLEAFKENYRIVSERVKSKLSSELLKAQMNYQVTKEKVATMKKEYDKDKLSHYIDEQLEYAENCVMLSQYAAEEAKVAFLEAMKAQKEYDEKYGKKE